MTIHLQGMGQSSSSLCLSLSLSLSSPAGGGAVELVCEVGAVKLGVAALGEVDAGSIVASGFTMTLKIMQII